MKAKTKLIMSIMSICLVCAVFAIGVFALKTANLKIAGDVSFQSTGVEATIAKHSVTVNSVANESAHFKTVTIDTTKTQAQIDQSENASSWAGLDITLDESGVAELVVAVTNNADTTTEKNNYIEVDSSIDLGTGNNVKITIAPKTIDLHTSDYIIAPGETDYYTITFAAKDIEVNASIEGFSFGLVLNHVSPVSGTLNGTKLTGTDGIIYTLNTTNYTASLGIAGTGEGDNYKYAGDPNLKIAPIVTDGSNNYIVTIIDTYAFYCRGVGNQVIQEVVIPNGVTSIGQDSFSGCTNLTSVTFPIGEIKIGLGAFSSTGLSSVTIPANATSIVNAFSYCASLTSIVVADGNSVYDSRNNCNAIIETSTNTLIAVCNNTIIPDSVTIIGDYALRGCTGLTSITIPGGVTSIGDHAFYGASLTSITIPGGVTSIGDHAFYGASLTSITIPSGVTSIGDRAFYNCRSLTSITILDGVKSISSHMFYNCSNLTSIVIPASVTRIGDYAFYDCDNLKSVKFENTTGWLYSNYSSATSGTSLTISATDFEANATLLTTTYYNKYWFRTAE